MRSVGMRELRENMGRILHEVAETREEMQVTHHGKVLVHLVPPPRAASREEMEQLIKKLRRLSKEVGQLAPKGASATDLIDQERRY